MAYTTFLLFFAPAYFYLVGVRQSQKEALLKAQEKIELYRNGGRKPWGSNDPQHPSFDRSRVGELRRQLLSMTGGSEDLAVRLVNASGKNEPLQSEEWYLEKAIHDLIRDRTR
jgi:hypothetical protein